MTKQNFLLTITAKTLLLIFVVGFMGVKSVNGQGANAPEAASFEPVDATDMVNLVTGNLSYVLPILNVPSPEGGYPIALSYHAGIAMDQEASWVGLGWSINPGSINRAVNGYPDDWGETNFSEFFYDKGWEENYHELSIGVSVSEAVSVGLGLSWGTNQSLGGYVQASLVFKSGESTGSIGIRAGTNGVGINGGFAGFNASLSTSGVGVGYSHNNDSGGSIGVNLNYNYSAGLSGGVTTSQITGKGTALNGKSIPKSSSLGINFSGSGGSINASVNGFGAGSSNSTNSNGGEYDVSVSSTGFSIPIYMFYIGWSHSKVKRSLFKYDNLYTSGILYPVEANKSQANEVATFSNKMEESHFMDVNVIQPFLQNSRYDDLIDDANDNNRNNLILPNYDNYTVSAQGLSGTMNPYTYKELSLSARGRGEQNNDNKYVTYLNNSHDFYTSLEGSTGHTPNEIDKKHFTFSSAYNSYLKLSRSNIVRFNPNITDSEDLMSFYGTDDDNSNGFLNVKRKKEGNHITTYTNKEIREGNLNGFFDAKEGINLLNRSNIDVFLDNGIGAYNVTTVDGKTYHYSLPVYQLESTFKNYNNKKPNGDLTTSEDENFFEINKTKPYATHWLLTAITGPDYYDKNEDGKVDKGDYGYWVEFDYGKWSDGYIWQTPTEEIVDKDDATKKSYSYSWGRKQIYYLDAIKTRTHTALFIKDIRDDNKSESQNDIKNFTSSNKIVLNSGDKVFGSFIGTNQYFWEDTQAAMGDFNLVNNSWWVIPEETRGVPSDPWMKVLYVKGKKNIYLEINTPEHKMLRLKKIILLKNKYINENIKPLDNFSSQIGSINKHIRIGGTEVNAFSEATFDMIINSAGEISQYSGMETNLYLEHPDKHLKVFNIHQYQNVINIKDIEGLNLESQAVQVIDFEHDYSLANNAPNAYTGRLTLKKVNFKGKQGVQVVPPYKFSYKNNNVDYNKDDIDAWGYHKTNPSLWSLNQITMPTGGKINIEYGIDEAISTLSDLTHIFTSRKTGGWSSKNFSITDVNGNTGINIGDKVNIYYKVEMWDDAVKYIGPGTVTALTSENNYSVVADGNMQFYDPIYGGRSNTLRISYELNSAISVQGGGITTSSITINDGIKNIAKTEYVYNKGITSYAPSKEPKGIPYVSELPAPMVLYGEVEMKTKDGNGTHLGSTVYEFETLEPRKEEPGYIFSLGEAFKVKENQNTTFQNGIVIANKYTIESRLGNIGRIKSVKSLNSESHVLNKTENFYKKDLDADGEIGVTQESHKSYKRVYKDNNETFYVSSTSKINYPSVLEKTTTTQGNFSVTQYIDKHDFLTGQALETRTYASDGKAFKSKTVPAYTIPEYLNMGAKVDNPNNKNMLTQVAASYGYLLNTDGTEKIISAGITTWNNNWNYWDYKGALQSGNHKGPDIWRKHKSFVWKGAITEAGIYTDYTGADDNFEWGLGQAQPSNSDWQQASETSRYDHYSMPLEVKDINGNYAATKMGDNNSKVLAVSNAAYTEMYYSGAEYEVTATEGISTGYFDGEVKSIGVTPSSTAHTQESLSFL